MATIILGRSLDPPLEIADVRGLEAAASWCMEQHRVRHATSLLSLDGRRLICCFDAPDAESVRSVARQLGQPIESVWTATVHAPGDFAASAALVIADASIVVAERAFAEPVELAAMQALGDGGAWCHEQHRVRFLRTYFADDRQRMICVYAAPDAESVRSAQQQAGLPVLRVWSATVFESHTS